MSARQNFPGPLFALRSEQKVVGVAEQGEPHPCTPGLYVCLLAVVVVVVDGGQQEREQPVVGTLSTSLSFEGKVRDCLCSTAMKDSERLNESKVNLEK